MSIKETIKKGDRVKIIPTEQTGIVRIVFGNGAMIERDSNEERRFTTVRFENLCKLPNKNN